MTRKQLTLFVAKKDASLLEQIRKEYNPIQYALIPCHVTLCREDEIENLEQVIKNINNLPNWEIEIQFGRTTRFDNDKGLLIPALPTNTGFEELRKEILKGVVNPPRKQAAHITLIHPRNGTCTDAIFIQLEKQLLPSKLHFSKISLIEQTNGGKWQIIQEFPLINKVG